MPRSGGWWRKSNPHLNVAEKYRSTLFTPRSGIVTHRLESILAKERIRVAVLTTQVPPEEREAWYERQLRSGLQVCIAHPRLVQTGLDY
jgi:hypothetical protein